MNTLYKRPSAHRTLTVFVLALALVGCGSGNTPQTHIAAGKDALAKKEPKAAVVSFKNALQLDPDASEARFLLGKALMVTGDPSTAASELSRALERKYDSDLVVPQLAEAWVRTGDYKKLVNGYENFTLKSQDATATLKTSLATAWGALGNKAKAEKALADALEAKPDFGPAKVLRARALASASDADGAKTLIQQVLAADANNPEAWHILGQLEVFFKKNIVASNESFRKALSIDPAFIPSHLSLISAALVAKDIPGAKAQAEKLRAVLPKHPQTLFVDAQIAFAEKDWGKAKELSQQLMKFGSNHVGVLQFSGAVEGQAGSLVVAESRFVKALQIDPTLPVARRNLGQTYIRLGQPQRALEVVQPLLGPDSPYADAHAVAGDAYLRLNRPADAEAAFLRAAALDPGNERISTAIALAQLSKGNPDGAFSQLSGIASRTKDTFADQALVSARLKRREFDAALAAVDSMAKKQPNDASAPELRGRIYLERRDYAAARVAFEEALKIDPQLFAATANLAALDGLEGKPAQARARFEAVVKADAKNYFARMALADILSRSGAPLDEVKAVLRDAITAAPTEAAPRLQMIDLLLKKRQYKEAMAAAQDAAATMPNDMAVLDAVGRAQMETGDVEQAVSTFRRMASIDQNPALAYVRLADVYKANGKRAAAETALRKAIELQPDLLEAQQQLIELLVNANRTRDALAIARQLQQRNPKDPVGYAFEALIHKKSKAPDEVVATYRRALAVPGGSPDLARQLYTSLLGLKRDAEADRFAEGWMKEHPQDIAFDYQIAVTALTRSDLVQAETRLRRVVNQRPNNPLALNNLAWVLAVQEKPGAIEFAQKAVNLMPDRPALIDTLAMALAADKQYAKALELQRTAVALASKDNGLRLNLAKIALKAGDKTLAKAELEALKAIGPSLPFHDEIKQLLQSI